MALAITREKQVTAQPTGSSRTFRVFVSSTFEDLAAERNALQEHVFPMLAAYCAKKKARFQAIDLRWGISQEAGLDQRAMAVCLTEIERCQALKLKPNFVVLLGDRYGWRPLPSQIEATEFKQILAKVPKEDAGLLEWTDKQPAGAKGWYRLDENAAEPEYVLRPREVDVPKGATDKQLKAARDAEKDEWNNVIEPKLRAILLQAIGSLGWSTDDPRMAKYVKSATDQEIMRGAFKPDDAPNHVFGFFRSITNLPADDPSAGFRDTVKTDKGTALDKEAQERLGALKEELKERLKTRSEKNPGGHVMEYEATWSSAGVSQDHIGALPDDLEACNALLTDDTAPHTLCVDVWRSIGRMIDSQLAELPEEESSESEARAHEAFGEKRCEHFVGREKIRKEIKSYVKGSEPRPLVVIGEGGSGKSALMAKALEEAKGVLANGVRVVRFIGATPAASEGRSLLDSLCHQIAHEYGDDESAIPAEYNDLAVEFGKQLEQATETRPLLVFLDALDQLGPTDPARSLSWLPAQLPEHVRLVVSTIPDDCEKTLRAKHPEPVFLTLDEMSEDEGKIALGIWLENAGRRLQDAQEKEVLAKFKPQGRPLYLKLAFEEARLWPSFAGKSETKLHAGIPELIKGDLFARLAAPENHGPVMVAHALGYLAASRYGLAEDELIEVLSADKKVRSDFEKRSFHTLASDQLPLPVVVWSRLYFDLAPYLAEHAADGTTLLAFYHRVLGESAKEEFLAGHDGKDGEERHSSLADYFRTKADPKDPKADPEAHEPWNGKSVRGLSELPFHLAEAGELDELYETLTDFHFLERKAAEVAVAEHTGADGETTKTYAGVFQLQDDYELALAKLGGGSAAARKPLIVTGVDFGDGMVIRCPWCNTSSPFQEGWRGTDIPCPNEKCEGPLKINPFVVGESMFEVS